MITTNFKPYFLQYKLPILPYFGQFSKYTEQNKVLLSNELLQKIENEKNELKRPVFELNNPVRKAEILKKIDTLFNNFKENPFIQQKEQTSENIWISRQTISKYSPSKELKNEVKQYIIKQLYLTNPNYSLRTMAKLLNGLYNTDISTWIVRTLKEDIEQAEPQNKTA